MTHIMPRSTILLVEDNRDDEELALRAFRKNNICNDIVVARDGAEALEFLLGTVVPGEPHKARGKVHPIFVLLDLKLPKIDGLEVLRRIRSNKETALMPVVVLTTSSEEKDILQSYRLGTNSYVRKPLDFTEFVETMRQLARYWLHLNEPPPELPSGKSGLLAF